MKVKDAMHVGVKWAEPDTSVVELAHMMRCHDVGAIPIGQNDRLIGIVTDRDIICRGVADRKDLSALKARDIMTPGVVWCSADEDLLDAVRRMEARKVRRMPVINADKRMVGILALGDISASASKALSGQVLGHVSAHH
ncbi:MAG: CBS domain-containing protein [Caulobacterales bacterium]|jgi:CBS domain-containing protein|nr:CBS domain-containing protein [Caulobacterales bacterium]